jgi:hypothetical protein
MCAGNDYTPNSRGTNIQMFLERGGFRLEPAIRSVTQHAPLRELPVHLYLKQNTDLGVSL